MVVDHEWWCREVYDEWWCRERCEAWRATRRVASERWLARGAASWCASHDDTRPPRNSTRSLSLPRSLALVGWLVSHTHVLEVPEGKEHYHHHYYTTRSLSCFVASSLFSSERAREVEIFLE